MKYSEFNDVDASNWSENCILDIMTCFMMKTHFDNLK